MKKYLVIGLILLMIVVFAGCKVRKTGEAVGTRCVNNEDCWTSYGDSLNRDRCMYYCKNTWLGRKCASNGNTWCPSIMYCAQPGQPCPSPSPSSSVVSCPSPSGSCTTYKVDCEDDGIWAGVMFCSGTCEDDAECGPGYVCDTVSEEVGPGQTKVYKKCVPESERNLCTGDAVQEWINRCKGGSCLPTGGAEAYYKSLGRPCPSITPTITPGISPTIIR